MKKLVVCILALTMVLVMNVAFSEAADVPLKSVLINEKNVSLLAGGPEAAGQVQLTLTFNPDDATDKTGIWSSSNGKVATVDEQGLVTAVAAGNTNIIFTSESGKKAQTGVRVGQAVTGITLTDVGHNLPVNKILAMKMVIEPKNAANKKLNWRSSDESVATVTPNGQIKGIAVGTAEITAEAVDGSGITAQYTVNVVQPVTKITGVDKKVDLAVDTWWKQTITVEPENATVKDIVWTSSKETVATVDEDGTITGIGIGSCNIIGTAADGSGKRIQVSVSVKKYDAVITTSDGITVDFETVDSEYGSRLQIGRYVIEDMEKTIVKFKNGCAQGESNNRLIPLKPGSDVVTVTHKHNKKVKGKKNYSIYVAQSAFVTDEAIETEMPEGTTI